MESRTNTSGSVSDRDSDQQWSFLHTASPHTIEAQHPSSHPPSSHGYVRSDRSIVSPLTISLSHIAENASFSRPSSRCLPSASTGARSSTSTPSQPVLLRINSANSHNHTSPAPRRTRRRVQMSTKTNLPALEEFSIQGILAAIAEDIETDLSTVSEILGRSRFVLADQHESHMPPQGEITGSRAQSPLQGIDELANGSERVLSDDVMIVHEDASLIEGSNSGSAAYGLLERLQVAPRTAVTRTSNEPVNSLTTIMDEPEAPSAHSSTFPTMVSDSEHFSEAVVEVNRATVVYTRHGISQIERGPSQPVVSETYLDAEADGVTSGNVPIVSEAGRHYPLYTHDDTNLFEPTPFQTRPWLRTIGTQPGAGNGFSVFSSWFSNPRSNTDQRIEARLRGLLNR